MSVLLPGEIVNPGVIKNDVWIAGVVVRIRERNPESNVAAKGSGKIKAGKKNKITGPRPGLELHLNGGTTPAEVILVECWDPKNTQRLRDIAKVEGAMRFTKVNIKRHSERSSPWTTSRLPYFMEIVAESVFESTSADASWQLYHPLTPLTDLHHLKSGKLVCLAGRVIEPPPDMKRSLSTRRRSR